MLVVVPHCSTSSSRAGEAARPVEVDKQEQQRGENEEGEENN